MVSGSSRDDGSDKGRNGDRREPSSMTVRSVASTRRRTRTTVAARKRAKLWSRERRSRQTATRPTTNTPRATPREGPDWSSTASVGDRASCCSCCPPPSSPASTSSPPRRITTLSRGTHLSSSRTTSPRVIAPFARCPAYQMAFLAC